tara:strand:+ start:19406 stop:20569 length:1164 start_codon:yes stop_codon:yes gene_type:complete
MAITVSKDGLYFPSGTNNIKWSQLRDTFKRNAPSEPQEQGSLGTIISGPISASDLLRETDRSNTNPYVPDCTENADIGSSTDWKVSQMRDSIKYYWITLTGTNDNFDLDANPNWNSNIDKTIVKRIYIEGDCGTDWYLGNAARLSVRSCNFTIDVESGGSILAAGGTGGNPNGGNGGNALQIDNHAHENVRVWVRSGGQIYGGGGGGGKGNTGGTGCSGTCWDYEYKTVGSGCNYCGDCGSGWERYGGCAQGGLCNCFSSWGWTSCSGRYRSDAQCRRKVYTTIAGGSGGAGGNGGPGRGHNYGGSLGGASGSAGAGWGGCSGYDGTGSNGCQGDTGQTGGNGGDWGQNGSPGGLGNGGNAGRAIAGSSYSVVGTINSNTIKGLYNP